MRRTLQRRPRPRYRHRRWPHRTCGPSAGDPVAKRVAGIEQQFGFCDDVGVAGNFRVDCAIHHGDCSFEYAAGDAFLTPDLAGQQLAVSVETGQFGGGAGAAWRTVVSLARTKHETFAVGARGGGGAKEFDVVDEAAPRARNAVRFQTLADAPCEIGEFVDAAERKFLPVPVAQVKPIAAPGDVTVHRAEP